MTHKIGTVCYATNQGLGILAKSFYNAGVITDGVVIRHAHRPTNDDWFPFPQTEHKHPCQRLLRKMCDSVDCVLFFETPFDWSLLPYCRSKGVRTALMVMYECMPSRLPEQPDVILCPSALDLVYFPQGIHLPVPVSVPWRQRHKASIFVHNAGNLGLHGRNGTGELVDALRLMKSRPHFILRTQKRLPWSVPDWVDLREGTVPYTELYEEGDVFVFPEKFNGLSLPLQEAYASGMCVMATDRFPNNSYLSVEPLIPVCGTVKSRISGRCLEFDEAVVSPKDIAATIDTWHGRDLFDISLRGKAWSEGVSWGVLMPLYMEALQG